MVLNAALIAGGINAIKGLKSSGALTKGDGKLINLKGLFKGGGGGNVKQPNANLFQRLGLSGSVSVGKAENNWLIPVIIAVAIAIAIAFRGVIFGTGSRKRRR